MKTPKLGKSREGEDMHYSVGALIKRNGKFLLIDRTNPPYGFAGIAGHIDDGESPESALVREVEEESGLRVKSFKLLFEEEIGDNMCKRGINIHYWRLYECEVEGELKRNEKETKSIEWYSQSDLNKLKLEPVWKYWFKKLGYLK